MSTHGPRHRRARTQPLAALLVALCLALLTFSTTASAGSAQPTATSSALRTAVTAHAAATHTLTSSSKALIACLRMHPHGCQAARRAVKRASSELTNADQSIAKASRHHRGGKHSGSNPVPTPTTPTAPVTPAEPAPKSEASTGSSSGSSGASGSTEGTSSGSGTTGSGTTGSGSGSSTTGSGTTGSSTTSSGTTSSGSTSAFEMGVVSGSDPQYELPFIQQLGAHTARVAFEIGTPVAQMESTIASFAKDGIRVLPVAIFEQTMPSAAEAQNLGSWGARFGPGGSFWQGKSYPAGTAITDIEFGNETSYEYQYSDNSPSAYATRAQTYALRLEEAVTAIRGAGSTVGVLAQGDSGGNGPEWVNQMFKAVPNLGQLVAGWTVHPYGPEWQSRIDNLISTTQTDGAPSTIPIYVTEYGLDTDNGRCLEYNFGWNKCMTYSEAASVLGTVVSGMRARYGSRLAAVYLYQAHDQQPTGTSVSLESYFGALQSNATPKGAYTTEVESLLNANP